MRSSGEQFGDTSGFETCFSQPKSGTKPSTTSTDDDTVVFMIDDVVVLAEGGLEFCSRCCGGECSPGGLSDPGGESRRDPVLE